MATEINKLATTNLVRDARLRQESVPSRNLVNEQAVTNSSNSTNADNVVPLNAIERQNIAVSVSPTPDAGQSARSSNTQSEVSDAALSEISRAVQTIQRSLEFRVDDASGRTVITVKDSESQEVIRQIQQALQSRGYYKGAIEGKASPEMMTALTMSQGAQPRVAQQLGTDHPHHF